MKRLRLAQIAVISIILCATASTSILRALGPVLISGVQVKGVGSNASSIEAVEVRNYSDTDAEVTNWCVAYASYTTTTLPNGGSCILPLSLGDKVFLKKQSAIVLATNEFVASQQTSHPGFVPDAILSSGLGNTTGQLYLFDPTKQIMNNIKWYTSASLLNGQVNLRPASGQPENISFSRISFGDDGTSGFIVSPLPLSFGTGGLYDLIDVCKNLGGFQEVVPTDYGELDGSCSPIDMCSNIDGIQSMVPDGLFLLSGECVRDECVNMDGVQALMPDGYMKDDEGKCQRDSCMNLEGLQQSVPTGYYGEASECIRFENRELVINELLPNVSGSDTGLEYIELYNPFDEAISLRGYKLQVGKNLEKSFDLPADQEIAAGGWYVLTSAQIPFTLLNTTSSVRLMTPAGTVSGVSSYSEPADDMSWSLIDEQWQYTNQKTPGGANRSSIISEDDSSKETEVLGVATLALCSPGKYRHPLTNRCRNIENDVATLASCDGDEYRNPDTNRCRKITTLTSSLTPCAEGQERNPDTNRCRSVASAKASSLTPCQSGYERNPETNRCRKLTEPIASANTTAPTAKEQKTSDPLHSPYTLGAAVAFLALGYGIYEWRSEIATALRRIKPAAK